MVFWEPPVRAPVLWRPFQKLFGGLPGGACRDERNGAKNVRGVFGFLPVWTVDVPYSVSGKQKTGFLGTARACTGAPVIVSETLWRTIRRGRSG